MTKVFHPLVKDSRQRPIRIYKLASNRRYLFQKVRPVTNGTDQQQRRMESAHWFDGHTSLFRTVFEQAPEPMVVTDASGAIVAANPAVERVFGFHLSEMLGRSVAMLYAGRESGLRRGQQCTQPDDDDDRWRETQLLRRKSGDTFRAACFGAPLEDGNAQPLAYLHVLRDASEQERIMKALRNSEDRFRAFADLAVDFYWETDEHLRYTHLFGPFEDVLGPDATRVIGQHRMDVLMPWMSDADAAEHARVLAARAAFNNVEFRIPHCDGDVRIVESIGVPQFDDENRFLGYRGTARDVSEQRSMASQLAQHASRDMVTGLANRVEFERRLGIVLSGADDEHHCLCYLDLDQFKVVNDTCGHAAGDELLRQVSATLLRHLRTRDTLARLGGDEFGVLLEHCTLSDARTVADTLKRALADSRFSWQDKIYGVSASIGVVGLAPGSENVAMALSAADSACYVAKENGRNRVHVHDGCDAQVIQRNSEMAWVERINRAIEDDRLVLWHQPIARVVPDAEGGAHFELLVRMLADNGELVAPGVFLPAAERYGIASRIDRWVLDRALGWFRDHPRQVDDVSLCAINLSGQSLCEEDFLEYVCAALSRDGIPPEKLCFEITETAAIQNLSAATRFIQTVKQLGCLLALDDFGSGLSSFAYLKTLDVDFLKVDGLFVKDIDSDPIDLAMVRSINEIGHVMGKRTIAEFVENADVLERLREIGVDFAQGYGVARPAPLDSRLQCDGEGRSAIVMPFKRPASAVGSHR